MFPSVLHKKTTVGVKSPISLMPFAATWTDLEIIILSEVTQTEKEILHDITYMWNLKYDTNERMYETDSQI